MKKRFLICLIILSILFSYNCYAYEANVMVFLKEGYSKWTSIFSNLFADDDKDGLPNWLEQILGLDPKNSDTDGDGTLDGEQIYQMFVDLCPAQATIDSNAVCRDQRTPGFWSENGCTYQKYTQNEMKSLLRCINYRSEVFSNENKTVRIIFSNTYWKYNDSDIDLSDNWTNLSYSDSDWPEGKSPLGFGTEEEPFLRTLLRNCSANCTNLTTTYYFRKEFNISNTSVLENLTFSVDYDDGFIAYLNGHEFWKQGVSDSNHTTYASPHESSVTNNRNAPIWPEHVFDSTELSWLVNGTNVIAVEMHQANATDSDLFFDTVLYYYTDNPNANNYDDISEMCNVLNDQGNQFERHLMTIWLNICSNRICENCGTNTALSNNALLTEVVEHCEQAYFEGDTTEIENCKNILDNFNNGNGFNNINYGVQCNYCPEPEEEEEEIKYIPTVCPIRWICESVDEPCMPDGTKRILKCRHVSFCSEEYTENIAGYVKDKHKPKEDEFEDCPYVPPEEEDVVVEVEAPTVVKQKWRGPVISLVISLWALGTALLWSLKSI